MATYNTSDLVSFGEFLLSAERRRLRRGPSMVSDADLYDWKARRKARLARAAKRAASTVATRVAKTSRKKAS